MELPPITHIRPDFSDGTVTVEWFRDEGFVLDSAGKPTRPVAGRLQVWFEREVPGDPSSTPNGVASVRLTLADGLTPRALQRFPWTRMLAVADAGARAFGETSSDVAHEILHDAQQEYDRAFGVGEQRRPGRRGHPDAFYEDIARRYMNHRRQGARNPTELIARDLNYSRNTVAGWIRSARRKGYLAPARRGRAG